MVALGDRAYPIEIGAGTLREAGPAIAERTGASRAVVVTEPAAWASDGVAQMLRTIERVRDRQRTELAVAGIVVNRLGRTRDARYWHEQLVETHGDLVVGPIHLRAAVAEASAQSLPLHALGHRAGAETAAQEFADLLAQVVPDPPEDA